MARHRSTSAAPSRRLGVYTGSFDPMTLGHFDIVKRAAVLFDEVIVAIGEARDKKSLFTVAERLKLVKDVVSSYPNIRVASFKGLAHSCDQPLFACSNPTAKHFLCPTNHLHRIQPNQA